MNETKNQKKLIFLSSISKMIEMIHRHSLLISYRALVLLPNVQNISWHSLLAFLAQFFLGLMFDLKHRRVQFQIETTQHGLEVELVEVPGEGNVATVDPPVGVHGLV